MSLINDALRKARQEAAEREGGAGGLEGPVVAGYWKRRSRELRGLVLGVVLGVGAAAVGAGAVWWFLTARSTPDSVAVVAEGPLGTETGAEANGESLEGSPADSDDVGAGAWNDPEPRIAPPSVIPNETVTSGAVPVTEEVSDGPTPERDLPSSGTGTKTGPRRSPTSSPGGSSGDNFVAEAVLDDATLVLDYLVYREDNPFAQINGRDVRVGGVVEGWVVREISENAVILERDDRRIELRVQ